VDRASARSPRPTAIGQRPIRAADRAGERRPARTRPPYAALNRRL